MLVVTYNIVCMISYVVTYIIALYDIIRLKYEIVYHIQYHLWDVKYSILHIVCDIVGLTCISYTILYAMLQ
jgi:hypothetical protein